METFSVKINLDDKSASQIMYPVAWKKLLTQVQQRLRNMENPRYKCSQDGKIGLKIINGTWQHLAKTIRSKYLKKDNHLDVKKKEKPSPIWKHILGHRKLLSKETHW